jgi:hypothetical protein
MFAGEVPYMPPIHESGGKTIQPPELVRKAELNFESKLARDLSKFCVEEEKKIKQKNKEENREDQKHYLFLSELIRFFEEYKLKTQGETDGEQMGIYVDYYIGRLKEILQAIRSRNFSPHSLNTFTRQGELRNKVKMATAREILAQTDGYFSNVRDLDDFKKLLEFLEEYSPVGMYIQGDQDDLNVRVCLDRLKQIQHILETSKQVPGYLLSAFPLDYGLKIGLENILQKNGVTII